ncbi:MAG TPA: choice-of-anchor B family protein, partial [Myxococcales bacterium]|nr:choice-of-anchor B family protein [Myxococcales bacterium]
MGVAWVSPAVARHPEHLHCGVHTHDHETGRLVLRGCESHEVLAPGQVGARQFLFDHAWEIGLKLDLSDLVLVDEQSGLAGVRTRYQQMVLGYPVYDSNVSVNQSLSGEVQALYSNYSALTGDTATPSISQAGAEVVAIAASGIQSLRLPTTAELVFYPLADGTAALAWKLVVFSDAPLGDFLSLVGATSGKLLFQENRIAFDTGSGLVYAPNPMQASGDLGLTDIGDSTSTALDNGRVAVTLLGLDPGVGTLKGEYVDLVSLAGGLAVPDANEVSRVYNYDRSDDRFEQVTIYHSIDSMQRYFHSLGFDDDTGAINGIRDFPTLAHAHWDTADQSFYSTGDNAVHFGDGGVDDGEDADVVAHEYGHAVQHDQNSCWGGGEMGAMGEGFGDYLAASFYNAAGNAAYQLANAACVAEWDATSYSSSSPPCLRRVDGTKTHPADLSGGVHADGEIWSAALWNLRTAAGGTATDQMVLESHFNVPCNASMNDAANEVIQADANLNGGIHEAAIRQAFCDRGILNGAECVPPSGLGLVYATSPNPAVAGQVATYTLTASNSSAATLTGIVLSATVPTGSTYVAASASDLGVESAGTVTWPVVSLAMGVQVERTFEVLIDPGDGTSILFSDDMESGTAAWVASHGVGTAEWTLSTANPHKLTEEIPPRAAKAAVCAGGAADIYGCDNVDLHAYLPMASIGGGAGSDGWGWTDPLTGAEYIIMGRSTGTSFIDISSPATPVYLGNLPTQTVNSDWRDVKVYGNYAFIVSEATGHGMQVFDLTQLRSVPVVPATFTATAHYSAFSNAHNLWINESSGFAYAVGTSVCSGGLHMIDISNPLVPTTAGCFSADGYTHDVECVNYAGPSLAFSGKELCFASNEDTLTVVDVSNKAAPVQVSRSTYAGSGYTHQGVLTPDHRYFLVDDELDEQNFGHNTKTYVWDMLDPANPVLVGSHLSALPAIDHNQYIVGDLVYQANYQAGLRILKIEDLAAADLCEVGYFDVFPSSDGPQFNGAWNVFPFFASGAVAINAIEGLAVVQPQLTGVVCPPGPPVAEHSWFASDPSTVSDQYLAMANPVAVSVGTELQFWHNYITEATYDGGVAEYSIDGGVTWIDLSTMITQNLYTGTISSSFSNPISGRQAYEGSSTGYIQTQADLSSLAGQSVQIRFRMASDTSVSSTGWHVDDVVIGSTVSLSSDAQSTGGATANLNLITVVVAGGPNSAPVVAVNAGLSLAEGAGATILNSALEVTDPDPG